MASFDIFASHTFANDPIRSNSDQVKPSFVLDFLNKAISLDGSGTPSSQKLLAKVLPFSNGRPLVRSSDPVGDSDDPLIWCLAWLLPSEFSGVPVSEDSFVYLGSMSMEDVDCGTSSQTINWAIDISNQTPEFLQLQGTSLGSPGAPSSFVDLRTLMVLLLIGLIRTPWPNWQSLVMQRHCWNGIARHVIAVIADPPQNPLTQGGESSAHNNLATREYILASILL